MNLHQLLCQTFHRNLTLNHLPCEFQSQFWSVSSGIRDLIVEFLTCSNSFEEIMSNVGEVFFSNFMEVFFFFSTLNVPKLLRLLVVTREWELPTLFIFRGYAYQQMYEFWNLEFLWEYWYQCRNLTVLKHSSGSSYLLLKVLQLSSKLCLVSSKLCLEECKLPKGCSTYCEIWHRIWANDSFPFNISFIYIFCIVH